MASKIHSEKGIVNVLSRYSVPETLQRLQALIKSRRLMLFAHIDFGGDAAKVGLRMRPTQLLIFGNPKSGTPLMIASPSVAIDLPLKALAWEDAKGKVWHSYNAPEYLKERHGLGDELIATIRGIGVLVEQAVA